MCGKRQFHGAEQLHFHQYHRTTQANNSCDMPNGSVNITANPASTTYTYLWSN
ncbi:MAG: SprB repeat-containing protein [Saprospiraceae bacterium]